MKLYGAFTKVSEQDDGTIIVSGIASSGAVDDAGETVTPEAMKAALPDYMKFGAVREMHGLSAAGTALKVVTGEDGATTIEAHVVDPLAIKKVQTAVYKGFSIGGKVLARDEADRTIITKLKLSEISLVDRPCNPDAVIDMWKADGAEPEGTPMTDQSATWAPTNEAVRERAADLAKAAGKEGRVNNFVTKARALLISEHAAVKDEAVELAAAGGEVMKTEGSDPVTEPESTLDPVSAVQAALEKAKGPFQIPAEPAPVLDLKKTSASLRLMIARADGVLSKGLYSVSRLCEIIDSLTWLQESVAWEATSEGDGSPLPATIAQNIAALLTTLGAMVAEESAEIVQAYADDGMDIDFDPSEGVDVEVIAYASTLVDLAKADEALMAKVGARHSKNDSANMQAAHDAMVKVGGVMCDPNNCPADEADKAAKAETLAKANAAALAGIEDLGKTISAQADELAKANGRIDDLTKQLADFAQMARPPKTRLGTAVSKTEDVNPGGSLEQSSVTAADIAKYMATMSPEELGQLQLRAALSRPQPIPTAR